jgi:uncharacterized protein YfiM (DUF2279 family)
VLTARLHSSLYEKDAVDAAVRAFGSHAQVELTEEGEYWLARVEAEGADERTILGELANFALGLTVEQRARR